MIGQDIDTFLQQYVGGVLSKLAAFMLSIQLYLGVEDIKTVVSVMSAGVAFFGWYIAYRVKRPALFRLKLAIVFFIPFLISFTYFCGCLDFSADYKTMILLGFMILLNILYWRELKTVTTTAGYHKRVLYQCMDMIPDLVWMKDVDGRFTYTNKAVRERLLLCSEEEAIHRTSCEIAKMQQDKGIPYTFGGICQESDAKTLTESSPCRFMESGMVGDEFLALQVFKAPIRNMEGKVVGTIGVGRDLTYDCLDHDEIAQRIEEGNIEEAIAVFNRHRRRYQTHTGGGPC